MSVVNLIPKNMLNKNLKSSELLRENRKRATIYCLDSKKKTIAIENREEATVYCLDSKKKTIAIEIAKKNMKLAAQKLDW